MRNPLPGGENGGTLCRSEAKIGGTLYLAAKVARTLYLVAKVARTLYLAAKVARTLYLVNFRPKNPLPGENPQNI